VSGTRPNRGEYFDKNQGTQRAGSVMAAMQQLFELMAQKKASDIFLSAGAPINIKINGNTIPTDKVVAASDFVLLHGNGVSDPNRIAEMVAIVRKLPSWRPMPVVFNEDDHFNFDQPSNNMRKAIESYASWGYFDPGKNDYVDGYQSMPINWGLNTPRKKAFFEFVKQVTGQ